MNNTINQQALADKLSQMTAVDNTLVETFLRTLTQTIADDMAAGKHVTINGIGTFGTETIGNRTNIIWQPDQKLTDEVNSPFSAFEPVVLADDITDTTLEAEPTDNTEILPPPIQPIENEPEVTEITTETPVVDSAVDTENQPVEESDTPAPSEPEASEPISEESDNNGSGAGWWIFSLITAAVIGYLCATYLPNPLQITTGLNEDNYYETAEQADMTPDDEAVQIGTDTLQNNSTDTTVTINTVVTQAIPEVTDTVRQGRFLATMARKHYGNYKFWVYIYKENADRIPNPDNLPVGTVLVIPSAQKYSIDANDPQSIARAEAAIRELEKH